MRHTAHRPLRRPRTRLPRPSRGFTLIELLVVVSIIVLLLGLLIPAASSARNSARRAKATATMTSLKNAFFSFKSTNDRMPGPFTQEELAQPGNAGTNGVGLTAMENALLELSGGLITQSEFSGGVGTHLEITLGNTTRYVDTALVGAADGPGYLTASELDLTPVEGQIWNPTGGSAQMPDLIDPWGNAYMLWARNDLAGEINPCANMGMQFAAIAAPSPNNTNAARSWFYWNTNAGVLQSQSIGKLGKNQQEDSLLGGAVSNNDRVTSMRAFLGHPSFPCEGSSNLEYPSQSYGDFMFLSAGTDGVYLERKGGTTQLQYPPSKTSSATTLLPEKTDDIWVTGS